MNGKITFQELSEELNQYLVNLGVATGNPKFAGYKIKSKDITLTAIEDNQKIFTFEEDEDIINSSINIVTINTVLLPEDKYTINNTSLTITDDGILIGDKIRILFIYLNIIIGEANPGSITEDFLDPELANKINNKSDKDHTHPIASFEDTMLGVNDTDIITPAKLHSYILNMLNKTDNKPYNILSILPEDITDISYFILNGDYLYIYSSNIVYKYNILSKIFTKLNNFPSSVNTKRIVNDNNGHFYFLSGDNDNKACYKYNIESDSYSTLSMIPYGFSNGSLVYKDNYIYMICGKTESNKIYKYSIENDSYEKVIDIPINIYNNNSILINNSIYIVSTSYDNLNGYICKFNLIDNSFKKLQDIPLGFELTSNLFTSYYDNYIYIITNNKSYKYNILDDVITETTSPNINNSLINIINTNNIKSYMIIDNYLYDYMIPLNNESHLHSIEYIDGLRYELDYLDKRIDDANHNHYISDIYNLEDTLNKKSNVDHKHDKATEIDAIEGSDDYMYMTPYSVKIAVNNAINNMNYINGIVNNKYSNEFVSLLPEKLEDGFALSYDNEIHILLNNQTSPDSVHYKFNGYNWSSASILNTDKIISSTVHNNEIHVILGNTNISEKNHYRWNGSRWTIVSTTPYKTSGQIIISFNNELHLLGGIDSELSHYKFNGESWIRVGDLPYEFVEGCAIVFNNEIHILSSTIESGKNKHYKFNGTSWSEVSKLPLYENWKNAIVFGDSIYIFENTDDGKINNIDISSMIYRLNNNTNKWEYILNIPFKPSNSCFVNHDNKVYILGGDYEDINRLHVSLLPAFKYRYFLNSKTKILLDKSSHSIIRNLKEIENGYEVIGNGMVEFYNINSNNDIHTII